MKILLHMFQKFLGLNLVNYVIDGEGGSEGGENGEGQENGNQDEGGSEGGENGEGQENGNQDEGGSEGGEKSEYEKYMAEKRNNWKNMQKRKKEQANAGKKTGAEDGKSEGGQENGKISYTPEELDELLEQKMQEKIDKYDQVREQKSAFMKDLSESGKMFEQYGFEPAEKTEALEIMESIKEGGIDPSWIHLIKNIDFVMGKLETTPKEDMSFDQGKRFAGNNNGKIEDPKAFAEKLLAGN